MTPGAIAWRSALVVVALGAALGTARAGVGAPPPIVEPYLQIQQLLAGDSIAGLRDRAAAVALEAAKLGEAGEAARAAAAELGEAADLPGARAAFGRLGNAIMAWAAGSGSALGDGVRVAYCPMARKYWLQKGEDIRNPFYGASMLDCGRLVDTIPNLSKK